MAKHVDSHTLHSKLIFIIFMAMFGFEYLLKYTLLAHLAGIMTDYRHTWLAV